MRFYSHSQFDLIPFSGLKPPEHLGASAEPNTYFPEWPSEADLAYSVILVKIVAGSESVVKEDLELPSKLEEYTIATSVVNARPELLPIQISMEFEGVGRRNVMIR